MYLIWMTLFPRIRFDYHWLVKVYLRCLI